MACLVRKFADSFKKIFILFLSLFVLACSQFQADNETDFCYGSKEDAAWDELLTKNPDNIRIQAFHALRLGLCQKVDDGYLTVEQAVYIFNTFKNGLDCINERASIKYEISTLKQKLEECEREKVMCENEKRMCEIEKSSCESELISCESELSSCKTMKIINSF